MDENIRKIISDTAASGSAANKKKETDLIQLVIFLLDGEEYAIPISDLQEIIRIPAITPIPSAPEFILGILNLRGKIVVVVDLEKRFNLKRENNEKPGHIIITEVGENTFGVMVDVVTEVLRVSTATIQPTPFLSSSKIHADYLKGVVVIEDEEETKNKQTETQSVQTQKHSRLIILLDILKMLQENELLQIGKVVEEVVSSGQ
jgi:purine-binding chemotaxis protein CheW